jgi:exodeoxyribonuclease VII large subunit
MPKTVYSVAQLNNYIKNMFTQDYLLQSLMVKGEISNCKYHSSGHIYFTLKDEKGAIACVMFAGNAKSLTFRLSEGQQVIVSGSVDVYERDGKYQLYARSIRLDGEGLLYERFEQLKKELEEQGMFAPEYKQPIPFYVRKLGVVTAPTGAAVRDIITVSKRRNPFVQIILYPAIVQGADAPASIVEGIHALEAQGVDVIIVGRGGGSIEDLWGFNERIVAQAIFDCSVPIISAVGHETDFTIADFVADLRAATPSAAAELANPDIRTLTGELEQDRNLLTAAMMRRIRKERETAANLEKHLQLLSPASRVRRYREDLVRLTERIQSSMDGKVKEHKEFLTRCSESLTRGMEGALRNSRQTLALYMERMKGLSPIGKLNSGFSYVADDAGKNVKSIQQVKVGDALTIHMTDGQVIARTEEIRDNG